MNRYAYRATGFAIKTISGLSNANVHLHGTENLPDAPVIFVINHFIRIETLLMPYYFTLFSRGPWAVFLDKSGRFRSDIRIGIYSSSKHCSPVRHHGSSSLKAGW